MRPSSNPQKDEGWGASGLVNMWRCGERGELRESLEAQSPFPHTFPYVALCGAVPELYPFTINWQTSK